MQRRDLLGAAGAGILLLTGCGGGDGDPAVSGQAGTGADIVAVAQSNPDLSTLVVAVQTAGLVSTLQGPGPFTVLAPVNTAFASLLTELGLTQQQLLADQALLRSVLTTHVVAAQVSSAQLPLGQPVASVQGSPLTFTATTDARLVVTDARGRQARLLRTDIPARNGLVHLIDRVLLPRA